MTKAQERDNPDSTFNRAAEDEPIFILRAADLLSPAAIEAWIAEARSAGVCAEKLEGARRHVTAVRQYQYIRPECCHVPD